MLAILKDMGIEKRFKPYCEGERDTILLETRKPPKITSGVMSGCEIDIWDSGTFRVWTSQKNKAMATSRLHGLKVRPFDGEAELFIPANLADELLPSFGAKVKRTQSEAQKAASQRGLNALNLVRNRPANAVLAAKELETGKCS
jgi:hypothetical protein